MRKGDSEEEGGGRLVKGGMTQKGWRRLRRGGRLRGGNLKGGDSNRQLKQYGTAIPLPHLEVSVKLSKVCSAAAPKGMQSCTTHGF